MGLRRLLEDVRAPRRRWADDRGATEVLGFVLMFALSSIVLVTSVQSFNAAKDNADSVVTGVELRAVANRVSSRVVQSALLAEDLPNASMHVSIRIPREINGEPYWVRAVGSSGDTLMKAATVDGRFSATASVFNVDTAEEVEVLTDQTTPEGKKMYSSNDAFHVVVYPANRFWPVPNGDPGEEHANTKITLQGVET